MKVLVYSAHPYEIPFLKTAESKHHFVFEERKLSEATVDLAKGFDAVALFTADDASFAIVNKLHAHGVRYIALRSAGYDHVDLTRCKVVDVKVANVPAYSPYAVAEHAVALLLSLDRKIPEGQRLLRSNDFRLDSLVGFDIHGKTVGIIGTGTIGMTFAGIMRGFGSKLIGYDPVHYQGAAAIGLTYVSLEELYRTSDIISIHCPLNEHTRHLISKPQLEQMKPNCILINTARGAIVNTIDLLEAIDKKRIAGACLDVYENEKRLFFEDHRQDHLVDAIFERLRSSANIIVTGHQGFLTAEALQGIAAATIDSLDHWERGDVSKTTLT